MFQVDTAGSRGVYTAGVSGYQDELAEFRASPEAVADVLATRCWRRPECRAR